MEIWIKLLDAKNYEVSNFGGFKIKGDITYARYLHQHRVVSFELDKGGRITTGLHRLVFEYFNSPIPYKRVINHKDGNKSNNHIDNLECITQSENIKHAYDNNLFTTRNYGKQK